MAAPRVALTMISNSATPVMFAESMLGSSWSSRSLRHKPGTSRIKRITSSKHERSYLWTCRRNCSSCSPFDENDQWSSSSSSSSSPHDSGLGGGLHGRNTINGTRFMSSIGKPSDEVREANSRLVVKPPDGSKSKDISSSSSSSIVSDSLRHRAQPSQQAPRVTLYASGDSPRKQPTDFTGTRIYRPNSYYNPQKTSTSWSTSSSTTAAARFRDPQITKVTATAGAGRPLSASSRRLLETANKDHELELWLAARNYQQSDHYDYSLFGTDFNLDRAVAQHQRQAMLYNQDRYLKDEQAKQVAPNMRQSPIAIMSLNPTYELQNKPLCIEYPATVENLRLNNTGFSWEVKIPYQISMTTALYGAHLNTTHHYRLDQFHCHWGQSDDSGSEHTVDNRSYSAEMHFVHYNMEKYHTLSKAARHSDGLVVLSVFVDARDDHHNHAELEKIVAHLKSVPLKGDHALIKQAVRIENLLPANRSYWSYQGSLTTPPYFESVTWFVLKHPIRCNTAQIDKFRSLKSSLSHDGGTSIRSNHRKTQPLNGRTIVNYDDTSSVSKSRIS